jgi:hypothetical protein
MNKVVGVALAGVAFYGLIRLLKMRTVSDLASFTLINPRVHNISLAGITLRTEVAVNNASRDSVKITKPVVVLTSQGRFISQSIAENKIFEIRPLAITNIDTIEIVVSLKILESLLKNVITKLPQLVASLKQGNSKNLISQLGIPMEMYFTTYVNGLFYQSEPTKII